MPRPRAWRLAGWAGIGLLAAAVGTLVVLWRYPSDTYVLLPDEPHPAASAVKARGEKPAHGPGGIYFLDVKERKATLLEDMFHGVAGSGASFVPPSEIQPAGVSESQTQQVELGEMALSKQIAAAVAERTLGFRVVTAPTGARVVAVAAGAPAEGKLVPGDVIVAVDGKAVKTPAEARKLLRRRRPGARVALGVRNDTGLRTVTLATIPNPADRRVPVVGIEISQAAQIHLPVPVTIDTANIGGPSAGLAFALEVRQKLGRDVDRGYKVAATGEIFLDGEVGPIGGVQQKTIGARRSGVDILLVPAGDNAAVARMYAGHMRVVPVNSFRQALSALATLPLKH